jgi:hypothetical protein
MLHSRPLLYIASLYHCFGRVPQHGYVFYVVHISVKCCSYNIRLYWNTVKPRFVIFVGGPEIERWIWGNDRCGGLYKMNKNSYICLCVFTEPKMYTNNIISTVKSNLHYIFLKKSLFRISLVAPFFFRLNNKLPILTMFTWSLMVMSWPYMNALINWNNMQANKKQ